MPHWVLRLLSKWPDFVVTFFSVLLSGFIAYYVAKWQFSKDLSLKKEAFLNNYLSECQHNLSVLHKLKTYIVNGPNIDHLWAPAEKIGKTLKTEAWGDLIKAGILPLLDGAKRSQFRISNRTVVDTKRKIEVIASNWIRIEEWHQFDQKENNQLLTQRKLSNPDFINQAREQIDYSIKRLNESIQILKTIVREEEL